MSSKTGEDGGNAPGSSGFFPSRSFNFLSLSIYKYTLSPVFNFNPVNGLLFHMGVSATHRHAFPILAFSRTCVCVERARVSGGGGKCTRTFNSAAIACTPPKPQSQAENKVDNFSRKSQAHSRPSTLLENVSGSNRGKKIRPLQRLLLPRFCSIGRYAFLGFYACHLLSPLARRS